MKGNPVYIHLTRKSRRLSSRAEWLFYAAIGVVGVGTAIGTVLTIDDINAASTQCYAQPLNAAQQVCLADILVLTIWLSGMGFAAVASSLALVVAVFSTGKILLQEGIAELWLTPISIGQIVDGYRRAVAYRLRILGVIGIGLVPLAIVIRLYMWGIMLDMSPGRIPAATLETGMLATIGVLLFHLAIATGVWVGFRRRGGAYFGIGGILLVTWVVFISITLGLFFLLVWKMVAPNLSMAKEYINAIAGVVGIVVVVAILWFLNCIARWGAYRAVERMRQSQ